MSSRAEVTGIAEKNHRHSVNNPNTQFQEAYSAEAIRGDKMIYEPAGLTRTQCSPTSDGSGAAIVASEKFVEEHGLGDQAIEIVDQSVVTDLPSTFADRSMMSLVGADMSRTAARQAYEQAGIGPDDVDVIELHELGSRRRNRTLQPLLSDIPGPRGAEVMPLSTVMGHPSPLAACTVMIRTALASVSGSAASTTREVSAPCWGRRRA